MWNYINSSNPTLGNYLFGAVKLVKNADVDKYKYSGYGIGFYMKRTFSFPTGGFGKIVIIFGGDMSSSAHVDNKEKDILILGKGTTQGLDDTALTTGKKFSINFTGTRKKFCLSLHYNEANSYLFVNGTEIIKFKAKDPEINSISFCLGNFSKDIFVENMKKLDFMYMFMILVLIMMLLQLMIY